MAYLTAARGLVVFRNELANVEGALAVADNVNIDEPDVITPRRGYNDYGEAVGLEDTRLKQVMRYKGRILRHFGTTIQWENAVGSFTSFNGSFSELEEGIRIKYQEANGNLFFTTATGIKKLSLRNADQFGQYDITDAGAIAAVDLDAKIIPAVGGFMPPQSKVAYRIVFGYKDRNNNLLLGSPSARYVLTNTSTNVRTPEKTQYIVTFANIVDGDYILYNTSENNYFLWFNKSGTATRPSVPQSVGRLSYEVKVDDAANDDDEAATALAQVMYDNISDITVDILNNEITVTNLLEGDVEDSSTNNTAAFDISVLIQGEVSPGQSANAEVTFTVPSNITTEYFYQVYRSPVIQAPIGFSISDIDPGDELNLVYESAITDAAITAGFATVEDITPETFRASGTPLYTNALSGQGILQSNERPPIAKDIALFKNSMFYANTKTTHTLQVNLLGVSSFTSGSSAIIIGNSTSSREYTFVGVAEETTITVDSNTNTPAGLLIKLYAANDERKYFMWFDKTGADTKPSGLEVDGFIEIRIDLSLYPDTAAGTQLAINEALLFFDDFNSHNGSFARTNSLVTIQSTSHGLTTGDTIKLVFDTSEVTSNEYIATVIDANNFTVVDTKSGSITGKVLVNNGKNITIVNTENGNCTNASFGTVDAENSWAITTSLEGEGEDVSTQQVLLSASASSAISIDVSARSLVKVINRDPLSPITAQYISGPDDRPGIILFKAKSIADDPFFLAVNETIMKDKVNPALPQLETVTAVLLSSGTNSQAKFVASGHGLYVGDDIYVNSPDTVPAIKGKYRVTNVGIDSETGNTEWFTISVNITSEDTDPSNAFYFLAENESDNLEAANRLYFSKIGQPEAVPSLNYLDVGPKDEPIERIVALRDSLFVLKTDGIYVVSGASAPNYTLRLMSNTSIIIAPDSAAVLNNNIYFLSTQGIVSVSEGADSIVSRQIENLIKEVTRPNYSYRTSCFGLGYENDRAYHLWMPTESTDDVATQCFRFNIFERTWTRWTLSATCGVIKNTDDKMYLGDGTRNYLLQERKNGDRTDHSDRNFIASFPANPFVTEGIRISSLDGVEVGDTVVQTQYVTIEFFNRLLRKLDQDPGLENDYESLLEMSRGQNITSKVQSLNNKLVADDSSGTVTSFIASSNWVTLRDQLNNMITQLNETTCNSAYKNYKLAQDVIEYEAIITSINSIKVTIKTNFDIPILEGDFQVYKHIKCEVEWQPQHFGDPSLLKQVREATVMFDQNNFYRATVSFSTDLSQDFVDIPFPGRGIGYWGYGEWGTADFYWGGDGNDAPFRTIVPAEKQRCRYLTIKLSHEEARSLFRIVGISAPVRQLSTRGYRK